MKQDPRIFLIKPGHGSKPSLWRRWRPLDVLVAFIGEFIRGFDPLGVFVLKPSCFGLRRLHKSTMSETCWRCWLCEKRKQKDAEGVCENYLLFRCCLELIQAAISAAIEQWPGFLEFRFRGKDWKVASTPGTFQGAATLAAGRIVFGRLGFVKDLPTSQPWLSWKGPLAVRDVFFLPVDLPCSKNVFFCNFAVVFDFWDVRLSDDPFQKVGFQHLKCQRNCQHLKEARVLVFVVQRTRQTDIKWYDEPHASCVIVELHSLSWVLLCLYIKLANTAVKKHGVCPCLSLKVVVHK